MLATSPSSITMCSHHSGSCVYNVNLVRAARLRRSGSASTPLRVLTDLPRPLVGSNCFHVMCARATILPPRASHRARPSRHRLSLLRLSPTWPALAASMELCGSGADAAPLSVCLHPTSSQAAEPCYWSAASSQTTAPLPEEFAPKFTTSWCVLSTVAGQVYCFQLPQFPLRLTLHKTVPPG